MSIWASSMNKSKNGRENLIGGFSATITSICALLSLPMNRMETNPEDGFDVRHMLYTAAENSPVFDSLSSELSRKITSLNPNDILSCDIRKTYLNPERTKMSVDVTILYSLNNEPRIVPFRLITNEFTTTNLFSLWMGSKRMY